ncbi:MAG: glutathione S-transferase family protein [Solirubrobacterales bacterium]|nr:glutathione S-transferase family protein [Solirubrobacterales bacterium]
MASNRPVLWHLPLSHYSEKVRWALDHKRIGHDRHAPVGGVHIPVALYLTRGRHYTFPVLELDGHRIGDSSAIIAALERRQPDSPLYPADRNERERALVLEEWFDEHLGPSVRRYVFHVMRSDRELFDELAAQQVPAPLRRYRRLAGAYARAFTGTRFQTVSDDKAARAREEMLAALDRLESELGDNQYLVGERFTVADLTAASLFYPLVLPSEGPLHLEPPPEVAQLRDELAGRRGYRWVNEMFARHRDKGAARAAG